MWKKDSNKDKKDTSWQKVGLWYGDLVGQKGHYYHQHLVLPNTLRLLGLSRNDSILDLACGEGVLARAIPEGVEYVGVDLAANLLDQARQKSKRKEQFIRADVTRQLPITKQDFSHGAMLLALQNVAKAEGVFRNVAVHLKKDGRFVLVINHPCFRIPRQSGWETDHKNKIQYRRIQSYLSRQEIPIAANPGRGGRSATSWSFHYSLSDLSRMMTENDLIIEKIEEWASDKKSTGGAAKMENRARNEIPLFMALVLRKTGR